MTIIALTCLLVVGAAATSILGRDSVPAARPEMVAMSVDENPVSNKESKKDRLAVAPAAAVALASFEPTQTAVVNEPLRQAFASTAPVDFEAPKPAAPVAMPAPKSAAMPLLFQLREDQKQEVRSLARIIGLEKVAEQI